MGFRIGILLGGLNFRSCWGFLVFLLVMCFLTVFFELRASDTEVLEALRGVAILGLQGLFFAMVSKEFGVQGLRV